VEHRVIGLARAVGHGAVRRVRDREAQRIGLAFEGGQLRLAFLDLRRDALHLDDGGLELVRLLVELGHLLVGRVALLAKRVELALQLAPTLVDRLPAPHERGNISAAAQHVVHSCGIQHSLPQ